MIEIDIPGVTPEVLEQRAKNAMIAPARHRPTATTKMQSPQTHLPPPADPLLLRLGRLCATLLRRLGLGRLVPPAKQILQGILPQNRASVTLAELTALHDAAFISNLFQVLLQRQPTAEELAAWLNQLRGGAMGKTELVSQIRLSPEGRLHGVWVIGLWPRALVWQACRLPLAGRLLRWLLAAALLTKFVQRQRMLEQLLAVRTDELAVQDERLAEAIRAGQQRADDRDELLRSMQKTLDQLCLDAGIGLDLDGFYAMFEQAARGTREEIRGRQQIYLAYVQRSAVTTGCYDVVDIGSGRGEWLELLQEAGFNGTGAELNRIFITESRRKGLIVADQDGVAYLRSLPAESLCLITAFQVVEHISFACLLQLLQAALQALKPGGCIILETPNPANLLVGSCSFYSDPTHRNPIVPATLEFILMTQGFRDMQQLTLHPPAEQLPCSDNDPLAPLLERWNTGQDYAVIGYKPAGGAA